MVRLNTKTKRKREMTQVMQLTIKSKYEPAVLNAGLSSFLRITKVEVLQETQKAYLVKPLAKNEKDYGFCEARAWLPKSITKRNSVVAFVPQWWHEKNMAWQVWNSTQKYLA